jgi:Skp family chaperone for outer membrane proteins
MTIRFVAILAMAILLAGTVASASAQGLTGVAVMDVQRVLHESSAGKSVQKQLEKQRTAYSQELSKQEKELRAAEQELNRQRTLISPEAFNERRRQFEQKVGNLQREAQSRKRDFDKMQGGAIRTMEAAITEIVQAIASERKFTLILPKNATILHTPELEITDEVMKRLNAKLPSVKVQPPAKTPPAKASPPGK